MFLPDQIFLLGQTFNLFKFFGHIKFFYQVKFFCQVELYGKVEFFGQVELFGQDKLFSQVKFSGQVKCLGQFKFFGHVEFFAQIKFLVACTRLYKPLCRSIGWLVHPSVAIHKTELNCHHKIIWAMETISNNSASAWCRVCSIVTAPAQQHVTKPSLFIMEIEYST